MNNQEQIICEKLFLEFVHEMLEEIKA